MLVIKPEIHKLLVRIANREDLIQLLLQKQFDLGLCCFSRLFGRQLVFKILEHLPYLKKSCPQRGPHSLYTQKYPVSKVCQINEYSVKLNTVKLQWLKLVGTVSLSLTHWWVRAIPAGPTIFKVHVVHAYFMFTTDTMFLWIKAAKYT